MLSVSVVPMDVLLLDSATTGIPSFCGHMKWNNIGVDVDSIQ